MNSKSSMLYRSGIILVFLVFLGYMPRVVGPGIEAPVPVDPYYNGIFPDEAPTNMAGDVTYTIENAFPNLTFVDPLDLAELPNGQLMMIGKPGFVWVFDNDPAASTKELVLDISDYTILGGDSGLLGVALHPDFANNGYFYLWYRYTPNAGSENQEGYMRLERFTLQYDQNNQPYVDPADPEYVLIQQFDRHNWHNGGDMFFGPDGFLYLAIGDEGGANDEFNTTQMIDKWLFGGVLRIDVDMQGGSVSHPIERQPVNQAEPSDPGWPDSYTQNYYIPNDNPWSGSNGMYLEEFFSIGTRSPHRMTYDPLEDEIWIGDIGQGSREEVSVIDRNNVLVSGNGANLQWPYKEGSINGPKAKPNPLIGYDNPPIHDYGRTIGRCVIGGFVYRGSNYPELDGKYIFSDHETQNVWTLTKDPMGGAPTVEFLLNVPFEGQGGKDGVSSFGITSDGTIYILDLFGSGQDGGKIHKLVRSGGTVPDPPETLSEVGAFTDLASLTPANELIPYDLNAPFWSDRALKKRWIILPNDGTHNTPAEQIVFDKEENWRFPPGTVVVKHFDLVTDEEFPDQTIKLETRFLIFDRKGSAYGVTYRWNEAQTEAFLLRDAETRTIEITRLDNSTYTQTWLFPSRQQCMDCHNSVAGYGLGLKTRQLNKDFLYPSGIIANQLETWNHLGMFDRDIEDPDLCPQNADLDTDGTSAEYRIRSYLDANCAYCHRPNGVVGVFDARGMTALHDQKIINAEVVSSSSPSGGIVVEPGMPANSVLWIRDNSVANDAMPPLAKSIVHENYIQKLTDWINDLEDNAPNTINEGWYYLSFRHSDKVLTVKNGYQYHNAYVQQQTEDNLDYQKWYAKNVGGDKYVLINQHSQKLLSVENMSAQEGMHIVQQEWNGDQTQFWYADAVDATYYRLINAYNGLCLSIAGGGTADGQLAQTALVEDNLLEQQIELIPLSGDPVVFETIACDPVDYVYQMLPQCRYDLKFVDSEETSNGGFATNAFDGDPNTIWHTEWVDQDPLHPHEIQINLNGVFKVGQLRYLPRQDATLNGTIKDYEVYLSKDGANWGDPVAAGTWASDNSLKEVSFEPMDAKYVRLVALSEVNGNEWTSAAEIEIVTAWCTDKQEIVGEQGKVSTDHNWITVNLNNTYTDPVVIAGSLPYAGSNESTVRVRNVTSTSFELRVEEWDCLDQTHIVEEIPYVVVESGVHKLLDGSTLIAGNADVDDTWKTISYSKPFISNPIVLTQCASTNESDRVVTRIDHAQSNQQQFRVKLQEGNDSNTEHVPESVAWIALEPSTHGGYFSFESGNTGVAVDHNWKKILYDQCYSDPVFISRLGSYFGTDAGGLRYRNSSQQDVEVFVEESPCPTGSNPNHPDEDVFYWVFNEPGNIFGGRMSVIKAKIYLQGPWDGVEMSTALYDNGLLPLEHPYKAAPWNYDGNECVTTVPPDAVDWVLVQVRHSADHRKVVAQRACFVKRNGMLMDLDGTEGVYFGKIDLTDCYLSIHHRNHLGVMTGQTVNLR